MRHPGLLELAVLLWVTPTLSLDRLVCSGLLTAYTLFGFGGGCTHYVTRQRERKLRELAALNVQCSPRKRVRFKLPEKLEEESDENDFGTDDGAMSLEKSFETEEQVHCPLKWIEKGRS